MRDCENLREDSRARLSMQNSRPQQPSYWKFCRGLIHYGAMNGAPTINQLNVGWALPTK
jgi:hypothetical protein